MKHHFTLTLASATLAASAAMAAVAPGQSMKVALPAGNADFYPSPAASAPRPAFSSDAMKVPRLVRGSDDHTLYGYLANTNIADLEFGMYTVDIDGGSDLLWQDELTAWGWSVNTGWQRDGAFCGLAGVKLDGYYMGYALVNFDLATGKTLLIDYINLEEEGMRAAFVSTAYRVFDDKVYGFSYNEEGEGLVFAVAPADDFHNVSVIRDVDISQACATMGYNALTDTMYGVSTTGDFVTVDTEGNLKTLYNLSKSMPGLMPSIASGLGWLPELGAFVYDAYFSDNTTALYALDPTAKSPVLLCEHSGAEIYSALFSAAPNAQPEAPAQATFKAYDFTGYSLDGTLTWQLPSRTVEGNAISGDVSYTFYIDGEEQLKGTAAQGSTVTLDASTSNGQHTFALVCSIGEFRGEPTVYHHWVGADAPLPPTDVKLTETTVSWDVPTGSAHDGYVDYSDITYTVYLNGGKIGATKETSLSYTLPEGEPFTSYTAEVQATYRGWSSPRAASNYIQHGEPLALPIHFRPLEKELELMTLINVDGHVYDDGTPDTWRFTTEMGFPSFASGYNGDDWLILPPMVFDNTEKAYRFEMEIGLVHDMDTTGTYEVCIGTSPTAEAMTRVIIPESRCYHMLGDILEEFFAVPEAGVYYIGIHTKTGKVSFHVSDMDISLSDRSAAVPVGVTGLEAIPGADAALTATVSFTMPLTTAAGTALDPAKELTAIVSSYATEPGYDKERELVATATVNGLPGSEQTVEIATAQNYNAIVVAISTPEGLVGKGEETFIYTGVDRPYIVNDLTATVSEDNMTITLRWTPPTEGEENGPIGDSFLYVIYDYISSSWEFLEEAGWDVCEYSFTVPDNFSLGYLTLGVMAYNAAGLSYHIVGTSAALGKPMEIPFVNDLDNDVTYDNAVLPRPTEQYNDTYWMPGDPALLLSPIFSLPSNFAFIGYTDQNDGRKTRVALPKVSTAGIADATMTFEYWGGRNAAPMRIMADAPGITEAVVIAELPADAAGWTSYTFKFPAEFQDQGWVALYVDADLPTDQYFAMFSGYSISSPSGVKGVGNSHGSIVGSKGMLTVSGYAGEQLTVADMQGRIVVRRDRLADHAVFALPAGTYIVRAGTATAKVLVP